MKSRETIILKEYSKDYNMEQAKKSSPFCQLHTVPRIANGLVDLGPMSLQKRLKFWLKRNLDARTKRRLKRVTEALRNWFVSRSDRSDWGMAIESQLSASIMKTSVPVVGEGLKAGDLVRVRSRAEIESTLDSWNELKGCAMMAGMWQYCGTTQRVFKVVERFVDERDYRLKRGTGIILLEGLICQGTIDYGRCDRSCFYFWRVEWFERIA